MRATWETEAIGTAPHSLPLPSKSGTLSGAGKRESPFDHGARQKCVMHGPCSTGDIESVQNSAVLVSVLASTRL